MTDDPRRHDGAYKYLFSNKRVFHQFITRFVDEPFVREIDYDDIELIDRSFVGDEFAQRESDIVYAVHLRDREVYIYVLLEFQSTVDKTLPLRMLAYILSLYERLYRNSRKGTLPAVFPILLYNGPRRWTAPYTIQELIQPTIPGRYIPSFRYYAVIENEIPDDVLKTINGLVSAVIYLEKRDETRAIGEIVDTVVELIRTERREELRLVTTWFTRVFRGDYDDETIREITEVGEVKTMVQDFVDGIAAKIRREALEEGLEQGLEKGVKTQARETVRRMAAKGFDPETIAELTGLDTEEVERLQRDTQS